VDFTGVPPDLKEQGRLDPDTSIQVAMQQFTVHYSQVGGDVARRYASEGSLLFALWPSPVNHDVCFREAGFTDFADGDETWDAHADGLLTRLLAELSSYGQPHLVSKVAERHQPWYRRPFSTPESFDLREQIELPIQWDELPDCVVAFGESGVSLRTGSGHHIFWIVLPQREGSAFASMVDRVAASHPVVRTELRWESLV